MSHTSTMRSLLAIGLILTVSLVAVATPASADSYTVGKCELACAGVCVADEDTTCFRDGAVCVGFSYQVPQCIQKQR